MIEELAGKIVTPLATLIFGWMFAKITKLFRDVDAAHAKIREIEKWIALHVPAAELTSAPTNSNPVSQISRTDSDP